MNVTANATRIREQIRNFVRETFLFGNDDRGLVDTDSFVESGVVDSTGIMELVAWIEESFGLTLDDADLVPENLDSVDRIEVFVKGKFHGDAPGVLAS